MAHFSGIFSSFIFFYIRNTQRYGYRHSLHRHRFNPPLPCSLHQQHTFVAPVTCKAARLKAWMWAHANSIRFRFFRIFFFLEKKINACEVPTISVRRKCAERNLRYVFFHLFLRAPTSFLRSRKAMKSFDVTECPSGCSGQSTTTIKR